MRACALDLGFALARYDDSYDALVDAQVALAPADRILRQPDGKRLRDEAIRDGAARRDPCPPLQAPPTVEIAYARGSSGGVG